MPTYAYHCENCGEFEKFQQMSDKPLDECPTCGAPVKRLLSGGLGVIMRGEGASSPPSDIPTGGSCPDGTCPFQA